MGVEGGWKGKRGEGVEGEKEKEAEGWKGKREPELGEEGWRGSRKEG